MIVTDGDRWEMYDVFSKPVPLEERRLMKFQLSKQPAHENALQALRIWKPNLASGSPSEAMEPVIESPQSAPDCSDSQNNECIKEKHPQSTPTPEPSADLDNSSEQPPDDEDSKPKAKRILIFEGERYGCKSYKDCWVKYCEILSERYSDSFAEVLTLDLGQRRPGGYFSKSYRCSAASRDRGNRYLCSLCL